MFLIALTAFILAFIIGNSLNIATGIPLTGGIANGLVVGIVLTFGVKGINKFGAGLYIWLIFSIVAIPTHTLGFPHISKVAVGISAGFIWDLIIFLFKWLDNKHLFRIKNLDLKNFGYMLGGGISSALIVLSIYFTASIYNPDVANNMKDKLLPMIIMNSFLGYFSVYIGVKVFHKTLEDTLLFKKLQNS